VSQNIGTISRPLTFPTMLSLSSCVKELIVEKYSDDISSDEKLTGTGEALFYTGNSYAGSFR
jgi:hypothetical protein